MSKPSLTRRDVLKRLGVVGGSSLVMSAMDVWDLMGEPPHPRPLWSGSAPPDSRVIILGGGISGLATGYELGKLEYDYLVLEARERVGGLTWTVRRGDTHTEIGGETQVCEFDEGLYFNAGAWRIPNRDQGVLEYCKELGVPVENFVNSSEDNFFYEDDPAFGPLSGRRIRLSEVRAEVMGSTSELLAKAMDTGQIDVALTEEDKERLLQLVVRLGGLDLAEHVYRPPGAREERYDLSALLSSGWGDRLGGGFGGGRGGRGRGGAANAGGPGRGGGGVDANGVAAAEGGANQWFQPVGGMQQICYGFHRKMGARVKVQAEVVSVRQTEDEVRVVWRDTGTGRETEEVADYVVSCLPMSVLKTIDINLGPDMAAAVADTSHSNSAKMGLQMRRRFWEEDDGIFGGHLWSRSLQLGEFSYPSNDFYTQKGILLGYYGGGDQAGLSDRPIAGRIEHVLTNASKVHPQIREEFESAYAMWWQRVPHQLGAYGRTPNAQLREKLAKADGRIFIGCAGTSQRPAWLQGAIQAAWRTVESVHQRVMAG